MFNFFRKKQRTPKSADAPQVLSRQGHALPRQSISDCALKVLRRLQTKGFEAYLVGGGVRDLLLKRSPKDFDVATNARPEEIKRLFRNCRLIGRRFRLAHIYFPHEIIEVSTFRAAKSATDDVEVMPKRDNEYGTLNEDAWRRDFTINALYYDAKKQTVLDFMHGLDDLKQGLIRVIGEPDRRFHEDPVRILRAVRLAAKLNLSIDPAASACFDGCAPLLKEVPGARLLDETMKLFFHGHVVASFQLLDHHQLLDYLFPMCVPFYREPKSIAGRFIRAALHATDERINSQQSINPGFLLAVLLWPSLWQRFEPMIKKRQRFMLIRQISGEILSEQSKTLNIPKRMQGMIRDVWVLQVHLQRRRPQSARTILRQRYFRAAIDFLSLRAAAGEPLQDCANAWFALRDASAEKRQELLATWPKERRSRRQKKGSQDG